MSSMLSIVDISRFNGGSKLGSPLATADIPVRPLPQDLTKGDAGVDG